MFQFSVITLFPGLFTSFLSHSLLKKAQDNGLITVSLFDLRQYAPDRHHVADDYPYGGGQGMVMKPEPLIAAIEDQRKRSPGAPILLLSPQGRLLDHETARRLSQRDGLALVCGRYEGVDARARTFIDEELSIGDYILGGGEVAAMVVIEAVSRLIPGVLGDSRSASEDSFAEGLLEHPHYTRPEQYRGLEVPQALLSGNHEKIKAWRREMSLKLTLEKRPDLLKKARLSAAEHRALRGGMAPVYLGLLHHPVVDKHGQVVTTAITNMDIHDIARSARTYGVKGFYVLNPVTALQRLAAKILHHWEAGYGSQYNETRKEALALVRVKSTLDAALIDIERECGRMPRVVVTSARAGENRTSFAALKEMIRRTDSPVLILFGTGWGVAQEVIERADLILEPVDAATGYNHLAVRSAAAIILDRLLGEY